MPLQLLNELVEFLGNGSLMPPPGWSVARLHNLTAQVIQAQAQARMQSTSDASSNEPSTVNEATDD